MSAVWGAAEKRTGWELALLLACQVKPEESTAICFILKPVCAVIGDETPHVKEETKEETKVGNRTV